MIIKVSIIHDDPEKEDEFKAFQDDELTLALGEAVMFLNKKIDKEMVV